jgi:hypothetical protein
MVMVGVTVPISVKEEDKLMVVSCRALEGFPFASCSCTKIQLYGLLSEGMLGGFTERLNLDGWGVHREETCCKHVAEQIMRVLKVKVSIFLLISVFSVLIVRPAFLVFKK